MGYKDMFNTQKIISEIFKKFEIEDEPYYRGKTRKKLVDICNDIPAVKNGLKTNLWDKTRYIPDGRKKAEHIFNETEKNAILNHPKLKEYVLDYLSVNSKELEQRLEQEVAEEKEMQKLANEINEYNWELSTLPEASDIFTDEEYEKILQEEAIENGYNHQSFYSMEESHQETLYMMIEALFLKYFTPIDEELLWKDMNVMPLLASTNTDFTAEQMRAIKRYETKDYYKPLENCEK